MNDYEQRLYEDLATRCSDLVAQVASLTRKVEKLQAANAAMRYTMGEKAKELVQASKDLERAMNRG